MLKPMYLPESAEYCIRALESAGFEAYAVGGCVRDALLGLQPHDYDLCTSATPDDICRVFGVFPLVRSGEKHGTIGVIIDNTVYEITTFRTEGGYQDSRHPDWVRFVSCVEEDLARRDFTVNAMAYSPERGYIDPWGGQTDLRSHTLRAVGDPATRFTEDALRILRGVRFSVRYGLSPEPETEKAMTLLAGHLERLARERIFDELCKLLPLVNAADLVRFSPILAQVVPELAPTIGFAQHSPYHAYDVFTHTAYVTERVPPELSLRWAALLHDIGKPATFTLDENGQGHFYGHAKISAQQADALLRRLKAPTALRERVVFLVEQHMTPLEPDRRLLRRRLGKFGRDAVYALLALQEADFGKDKANPLPGSVRALLDEIMEEEACLTVKDLAVNGSDLLALGIQAGPKIGQCLEFLLTQVQDETLQNEKAALLPAAEAFLRK